MGWMTEGLDFESRQGKELSFLHVIQIGCGVQPTSYPKGTGGFFPQGVKWLRHEAEHSPPTSAQVK
jgi:hypothetical protein